MMVFDHVDLRVADVERCRAFYDALLRAFGFRGKAQPDGARAYEAPAACPEIADPYDASFFEDPDGNRLEIVCR